ncbi:hypothetical protein JKF63_03931 [Porcisia hertigi]|uniref:Leishmanolysin n=1 Tax=Porcisia hertigi TaxID=2761500 RepID=A0A836IL14_9TRYP|nr:hypothetical protein JKF63_03931 [Porcisia hertigi]
MNIDSDAAGKPPPLCGHAQIISKLGEPPLTYVTLRTQVNSNLKRSDAPAAVKPRATVTASVDSTDREWAPIRIAVFTPDLEDASKYCTAIGQSRPDFRGSLRLCTEADILTEEKKNTLINVLPQAVNMHAQRLKVRPLAAHASIVVNSLPGKYCGSFTVPTAHQTTGVSNADFVVYVAAGPTSKSALSLAWACPCQYHPDTATLTRRPAVGVIYFNPRSLPSSMGETQEEIDLYGGNPFSTTDSLRRVAAHELLHALGFTSSVFEERGMLATVPYLRGKINVPVINSSAVRAAAKKKYGIADTETFYGVELEEEGTPEMALSHWKRRTARDELMAPVLGLARYSSLSLAAMEDTGFYKVNLDKAEPVDLGASAGGKLFTEPCLTEGTTNHPTVFCDSHNDSVGSCTADGLSIGWCALLVYPSALPPYAQYFPGQPSLGGSLPYTDYCPLILPYHNTHCGSGSLSAMPGSLTGSDARCFKAYNLLVKSSFKGPDAICARVRCNKVSRTYDVLVSGANSWFSCGAGGTGMTIEPAVLSPEIFVNGGTIGCQPYDVVCYANPDAFPEVEREIREDSPDTAIDSIYKKIFRVFVSACVFLSAWIP